MSNIYVENGYKSRRHYIETLAEERGLPEETVFMMADLYGPNEDFDGLVTTLDDMAEGVI